MKDSIQRTWVATAAMVSMIATGLSSCSPPTPENASKNKEEVATPASPPAEAAPEGTGQDQSSQNAKALLKAMSDYLAAQKEISLSYDSIFEVVTDQKQKLQIATSGTVALSRPDKIRTSRQAGFADTEMVYDGKTLSFLGKGMNAYVQTEAPGTIDALIDQLRDRFHRQLPGADLLLANPFDGIMTDVTDVKDLGSGVIGGKECDHIALRSKETDVQLWIAQGDQPYPCRYVITSKGVDQSPQFTMVIRDWKAGPGAAGTNFSFAPPAGARKLDVKDLATIKETSDLPENYRIGAAK